MRKHVADCLVHALELAAAPAAGVSLLEQRLQDYHARPAEPNVGCSLALASLLCAWGGSGSLPTHAASRQHKRPKAPAALRIYEAHVGMSSEEPEVASYTYFKGEPTPIMSKQQCLQALCRSLHSIWWSVLAQLYCNACIVSNHLWPSPVGGF